jgi:hypothetical protein
MRVNLAHIRERSSSGGWIDFAVFDAKSNSASDADNGRLLHPLTAKAIALGLRIDQSALAYAEGGRLKFYGTTNLLTHLSSVGLPQWTHHIDV